MGECSYNTRTIRLAAELTPAEAEETFVHELLHALLSVTGDEMLGPALEEHVVELLDGPLLRLIRGLVFKEGWGLIIFLPQSQESLPVLTCKACPVKTSEGLVMVFCDFCAAATFGALDEHESGYLRTFDEILAVLTQLDKLRKEGKISTAEEVNAFFDRRKAN
jgi:hypothetical protein